MNISLENWLRSKLDDKERMQDYELATDTLRCWIEEYKELSVTEQKIGLVDTIKRFEIDFAGNVLTLIEIQNDVPKLIGAMDGWGNGIQLDKCSITEK